MRPLLVVEDETRIIDAAEHESAAGDLRIAESRGRSPGGRFMLGSVNDSGFVFDNEQWAHEVVVEPFSISRTAVRQAEFAGVVNDAGYRRRELWSDEGWRS